MSALLVILCRKDARGLTFENFYLVILAENVHCVTVLVLVLLKKKKKEFQRKGV